MIVHFGVLEAGAIHPLCGQWGTSRSWTTLHSAVTCPRCLERMAAAPPGAA